MFIDVNFLLKHSSTSSSSLSFSHQSSKSFRNGLRSVLIQGLNNWILKDEQVWSRVHQAATKIFKLEVQALRRGVGHYAIIDLKHKAKVCDSSAFSQKLRVKFFNELSLGSFFFFFEKSIGINGKAPFLPCIRSV